MPPLKVVVSNMQLFWNQIVTEGVGKLGCADELFVQFISKSRLKIFLKFNLGEVGILVLK